MKNFYIIKIFMIIIMELEADYIMIITLFFIFIFIIYFFIGVLKLYTLLKLLKYLKKNS